jgi:hypothetical protein
MRVRCNSPVGSSPMSSARKSSFSKLLFFRVIPRDPVIARGCGFQGFQFCTAYNRIQRYITAFFLRILMGENVRIRIFLRVRGT